VYITTGQGNDLHIAKFKDLRGGGDNHLKILQFLAALKVHLPILF
jgi:hypothetical protein